MRNQIYIINDLQEKVKQTHPSMKLDGLESNSNDKKKDETIFKFVACMSIEILLMQGLYCFAICVPRQSYRIHCDVQR